MRDLSDHARGALLATLGIILVSPDGLIVRLVGADTWAIVFWRGLLPAVALLAFCLLRYQRSFFSVLLAIGRPGLLAAALFALGSLLFVFALRNTSVANVLVILGAEPLCAALLTATFLHEHVARRTWVAAFVVACGLLFVFAGSLSGGGFSGDMLALAAVLCIAGKFVVLRYARTLNMVPSVILGGLLMALLVWPMTDPFVLSPADAGLLWLFGAVILPVSLALFVIAPRYVPVPQIALIMLLETVLGPLWVWLVLSEVPAKETFIGGALIILTLSVHSVLDLRHRRREKSHDSLLASHSTGMRYRTGEKFGDS